MKMKSMMRSGKKPKDAEDEVKRWDSKKKDESQPTCGKDQGAADLARFNLGQAGHRGDLRMEDGRDQLRGCAAGGGCA